MQKIVAIPMGPDETPFSIAEKLQEIVLGVDDKTEPEEMRRTILLIADLTTVIMNHQPNAHTFVEAMEALYAGALSLLDPLESANTLGTLIRSLAFMTANNHPGLGGDPDNPNPHACPCPNCKAKRKIEQEPAN